MESRVWPGLHGEIRDTRALWAYIGARWSTTSSSADTYQIEKWQCDTLCDRHCEWPAAETGAFPFLAELLHLLLILAARLEGRAAVMAQAPALSASGYFHPRAVGVEAEEPRRVLLL